MSTQQCSKCGVVKPLAEFRRRSDGLRVHRKQCKQCMNAAEASAKQRRSVEPPK